MMAATIFLYDHVSEYAAKVRSHLADLTPEQVDDLTDGLEADLMEAVEDPAAPSGPIPVVDPGAAREGQDGAAFLDLAARFGAPAAYAQELRAAAGLPAVPSTPSERRPGPVEAVRAGFRETVTDARHAITGHPRWPAVRDFLLVLRPVWWVARAWVLASIVASILGGRGALLVAFVVLTVVSVQYGRGRWTVPERWSWIPTLLSALALVLLLPFAAAATDGGQVTTTETVYGAPAEDGVYVDGELVDNLFVYGPDGTFLDGAQIVDDEGRPVRTGQSELYDPETGSYRYLAPRTDEYDRAVPNAYPVPTFPESDASWEDGTGAVLADGAEADVPAPPVARLAPLSPLDADGASAPTTPTGPASDEGQAPAAQDPAQAPAGEAALTDPAPSAPTEDVVVPQE